MNCEDFDKIVTELADYQPMLSAARDAGVSHAAWCADCARKLVDTRAVSASLLLAAGAESETAPPSVKANLLAAFAEQALQRSTGSVVQITERRTRRWPIVAGLTAAVAAAILLAAILPLWQQASRQTPPPIKAAVITPAPNNVGPSPAIKIELPAVSTISKKPNAIRRAKPAQPASGYQTVATKSRDEYVPLTYLAKTTAIDTGMIVRVRLSRSALVSLGLPVNLENTSDSVSAEVVMGDDGVARAIRLVQ